MEINKSAAKYKTAAHRIRNESGCALYLGSSLLAFFSLRASSHSLPTFFADPEKNLVGLRGYAFQIDRALQRLMKVFGKESIEIPEVSGDEATPVLNKLLEGVQL